LGVQYQARHLGKLWSTRTASFVSLSNQQQWNVGIKIKSAPWEALV